MIIYDIYQKGYSVKFVRRVHYFGLVQQIVHDDVSLSYITYKEKELTNG